MVTMGKGAVVAKFTLALGLEKFAFLRLVVAIRNIHHFEHEFVRKWIFSLSELLGSMSKMAIIALGTVSTTLLVMFTKLRFVKICQIL